MSANTTGGRHLSELPDRLKTAHEAWLEARAADPLNRFYVNWDSIGQSTVDEYKSLLDRDPGERQVHSWLKKNPLVMAQYLHGGHGRWVIPEKQLGAEFRLDYAIGERSSIGFEWTAVELQRPKARFFTKRMRMSADFDEAFRQIAEWRRWLTGNLDYARKPRVEDGLGLTDISTRPHGLIILGAFAGSDS